jgi:hypothetical protein
MPIAPDDVAVPTFGPRAELAGAAAAKDADRGAMAKLTDERKRALRILARSPNGCLRIFLQPDDQPFQVIGRKVLLRHDQQRIAQRQRHRFEIGPQIICQLNRAPLSTCIGQVPRLSVYPSDAARIARGTPMRLLRHPG